MGSSQRSVLAVIHGSIPVVWVIRPIKQPLTQSKRANDLLTSIISRPIWSEWIRWEFPFGLPEMATRVGFRKCSCLRYIHVHISKALAIHTWSISGIFFFYLLMTSFFSPDHHWDRPLLLLLIPPSGSEPIYHVSSNAANEMELEECPSDDINSIITRKSIYKRKCKKYTTTSVDQIHRKRYFGILSDMHWICPFSSLAFLINCTPIKTFRGYDLHVFPLITPQLSHRHLLSIHSLITDGKWRWDSI